MNESKGSNKSKAVAIGLATALCAVLFIHFSPTIFSKQINGFVSVDVTLLFNDGTVETFQAKRPVKLALVSSENRTIQEIQAEAAITLNIPETAVPQAVDGFLEVYLDDELLNSTELTKPSTLEPKKRAVLGELTITDAELPDINPEEHIVELTVPSLTVIFVLDSGKTYTIIVDEPVSTSFNLRGEGEEEPEPVNGDVSASYLQVVGNLIRDSEGNTIFLRGVNQPGMVDSPSGLWRPEGGGLWDGYEWDSDAVEAHLDEMKNWGVTAIRMGHNMFDWRNDADYRLDQNGGHIDIGRNYKANLKDIITFCGLRNIYYIYDYHTAKPWPYDVIDPLPYPPYTAHSDVCPSRDNFVNYWQEVATELKDYPNVLFDLINEPHSPATRDEWQSVCQDCIDTIRSTGAKQPIILEWGWSIWTNLNSPHNGAGEGTVDFAFTHPFDDPQQNLIYSFHVYQGPHGQLHDNAGPVYTRSEIETALIDCGIQTVGAQYPVLCGETGAYYPDDNADEQEFLRSMLSILNEWGMHWTVWCWSVPAHYGGFALLQDGIWIPPQNSGGDIVIEYLGGSSKLGIFVTPTSATVYPSYSQVFKSSVGGGTPPYSYSWKVDGTRVSTASQYTFVGDEWAIGQYDLYCTVTDLGGLGQSVDSNHVPVYVTEIPVAEPFYWPCDAIQDSANNIHFNVYHGSATTTSDADSPPSAVKFTYSSGWGLWAEAESEWGASGRNWWNWQGLSTITFAIKVSRPDVSLIFAIRANDQATGKWSYNPYTLDTSGLTSNTWHTFSVDITQPDDNGALPFLVQVAACNWIMERPGDISAGDTMIIDSVEGV